VDWELTLDRVRSAAEFCAASGLVRFRVEEGDLEVEVRRRVGPAQVPVALESHPAATAIVAAPSTNGSSAHETTQPAVLKADVVGIVRLARPAVAEGALLAEDRELAYVESLGVRNPVRSNGPGRVVAVYVTDGEPVEFGQPLFGIESV
jgi:acetyl-CoA carboxylase biotin carboxyl carrier protein